MRVLNKAEKEIYKAMINMINVKKLDCWDLKIPKWFENHKPCDDSKEW